MLTALTALVSAAALLAACGPNALPSGADDSAAPAANTASNKPPRAGGVAFRQEATMYRPDGATMPEVIYHDGAKMRTDMNGPGGSMINIVNGDSHESISIMQMGGRTIARRITLPQGQATAPTDDQMATFRAQMQSRAHRVGSCTAGGETGGEWSIDAPAEASAPAVARTMCVTDDGIMIQMKQGERVVFDTQSLQRGPQAATLFQAPPGVQVTDMQAPSASSVAAAMARARAAAAAAGH